MITHSTGFPAVAVVGHLVRDEILTLDGKKHISLGGIAYNLAALAAIQKTGTIYPVCRMGNDIDDLASALFALSPLIDPSYVRRIGRPHIVNRLVYRPDGSREEWNSGRQTPLQFVRAIDDCDAILLNFISGNDIRLGELLSFRERFSRLIFCDFHSLSLGYGSDHHRFHRYHPYWRGYLSAADIVQMNIFELSTIARRALPNPEAVFEACALLHGAGPNIAVITTGQDGMMLSISSGEYFYHVPAIEVGGEVDATGCGDTVSAAFLYFYLKSNDAIEALEMANWHAAAKATFSGISGFREIDSILSKIGPPAKAIRVQP